MNSGTGHLCLLISSLMDETSSIETRRWINVRKFLNHNEKPTFALIRRAMRSNNQF